jgi:hypothetical protein
MRPASSRIFRSRNHPATWIAGTVRARL